MYVGLTYFKSEDGIVKFNQIIFRHMLTTSPPFMAMSALYTEPQKLGRFIV